MPLIPFLQPSQPLHKPPKDCAWSIHPGIQQDGSLCSAFLEPCGFRLLPCRFREPFKAALKWAACVPWPAAPQGLGLWWAPSRHMGSSSLGEDGE